MVVINDADRQQLGIAIGVVVLSVAAIASFALTGGSVFFYALAVLTILLGFYMAYVISREGAGTQMQQPAKAKKKR